MVVVMARPHRIEFPGALYHVLVRGNQKQEIFLDEQDRRAYLQRIQRYKEKKEFILYAYVLMPNHVHLLIETPQVFLSKIMQGINLTYTQYFNRKYDKVGHIFQGRYKAFLCDRDEYLLSLVRYIHLNPVRANLVKEPRHYMWSSHNEYLRGPEAIVDASKVLKLFSDKITRARAQYEDFVNEAIGEKRNESFYNPIEQQILGDEKFLEEVGRRLGRRDRILRKPSFNEILLVLEEVTGVGEERIGSRGRGKEIILARAVLVGVWRDFGYKLVELQPMFRRDLSVLSRLAKISESPEGRKLKNLVCEMLNARLQA
jgi:putative transposase